MNNKGKNNPNYKHGRYCKMPRGCINCGKKITIFGQSGKCRSCSQKNKTLSKETRLKMSIKAKKNTNNPKNCSGYIDGRTLEKYLCVDCGKNISYQRQRCKSCENKKRWRCNCNKWRKQIFKGLKLSPNKPETLLNKLLPKTYKFVGDGNLIVGGFCPDFVNKDNNKIIEMFGDYWHKRPEVIKRDKYRIKTYAKYGYKTLIVWEHELKDLNKVKNKLLEFNLN